MFSFLSYNYFVRSSIVGVRLVFIGINKFVDPLKSNLKKTEVGVVLVDEYYKML